MLHGHSLHRSQILADLFEDSDNNIIVSDVRCVGERFHAFSLDSFFGFFQPFQIEINDCNIRARFRQCNGSCLANA